MLTKGSQKKRNGGLETGIENAPGYNILSLFFFFSLLIWGCNNNSEKPPDVSGIKISLQTWRFDTDFYAIDTNHIGAGLQKLHAKYPDFLNYYLDTFMAFGINGHYADTGRAIRSLDTFLTYKDYKRLEDSIKKYYPDSKETDGALAEGFRLMKYYYPSFQVPRIFYINSGLSNWPCFPLDKRTLCIGLDWFLGDQYPFYESVGVPNYMDSHVRKTYLPVSVFSAVYKSNHPLGTDDKTLLDLMIQRGKEQYFLHKVLAGTPDSVLFGFTKLQLDWCVANESLIYNFFIHQQLLYNKDPHNIQAYITDGPYAVGLESTTDPVKSSPGNVGEWLGYRIVCQYMALHPKTTLAQLTGVQTDPAKFLDESKYRPR